MGLNHTSRTCPQELADETINIEAHARELKSLEKFFEQIDDAHHTGRRVRVDNQC